MGLSVAGRDLATTPAGFLVCADDWGPEVAEAMAARCGISLGPVHWQVIDCVRRWCQDGREPPSMRQLVAEVRRRLGPEHASSIALMRLFGSSPARMCARIAGLPLPKNCL